MEAEDISITPVTSNTGMVELGGPIIAPLRRRNDSCMSIDTSYTVRTAYNDTAMNPVGSNFNRMRQNSSASIASSIFSEMPAPQMEQYQFTQLFDDELYSFYTTYSQQPNITPFDTRYPPSGVLSNISKLFYESILSKNKLTVDYRNDVNEELIGNKHTCLAVIRLRIIQLCSIKNSDSYGSILPVTRTNSIASTTSYIDRVVPGQFNEHGNSFENSASASASAPAPFPGIQLHNLHKPSWLHLPENSNYTNFNQSMDSFVDRVYLDDADVPTPTVKREKPTLVLNTPLGLKTPTPAGSNARPSFSMGPAPTTPNTPSTPAGLLSFSQLRGNSTTAHPNSGVRGLRSSSMGGANTPTGYGSSVSNNYFQAQAQAQTQAHPQVVGNQWPLTMPPAPHLGLGAVDSPYEQGFPSPIGDLHNHHQPSTPTPASASPQNAAAATNFAPGSAAPSLLNAAGPSAPTRFNATAARKRDSLNLKRGLN